MSDETKTKNQLIAELHDLRGTVASLQAQLLEAAGSSATSGSEDDRLRDEIEKRTRIEKELDETERLYRTLVETAKDIIWTVDLNLNCTYVSPSVTEALGFTVEEILDLNPLDLLTPESRIRVFQAFQEEIALEAAGPRNKYTSRTERIERYRKDGSTRWEEITTTFLRDGNGIPVGILGVSHDITEQKQMEDALHLAHTELGQRVEERTRELVEANARLNEEVRERKLVEEALRESEQRLELALHGAELGLWDWFVQTGRGVINKRSAELIGYDPDEIQPTFDYWQTLVHPDDRQRAAEAVLDHLEGRNDFYEDEYRVRTRSGKWKWIQSRGKVVARDDDGKPLRMAGTFRDITERKHAEEELVRSEERFRTVADFTYDWEYWGAPDGTFLYVSPSCERVTGYSAQEFMDDPTLLNRIVHPKDLNIFTEHWEQTSQDNSIGPGYLDFRIVHRNGEVRWINHACQPVQGADGRPLGRRACNRDITDRKRAEDALAEKEARYRTIFESMSDGVAIFKVIGDGEDFVFVDFNTAASKMSGLPEEEVIGRSVEEVFPAMGALGLVNVLRKTWQTGRPMHNPETRYRDERIDVVAENFVAPLPSGELVAVFRDVTERRRADDAVREARSLLESILAAVPVGIALHRGRCVEWANDAWAKMFGFGGLDECVGQETRAMYPSEASYEGARKALYAGLASGGVSEADMRLKRKDGSEFDAIIRTRALDPSDIGKGVIGAIADASDRKRAEIALKASEAKYRATFNNAAVGMSLVDEQGRFVEANDMVCTFLGYTLEELQNLTIPDVTHPEDIEMSLEKYAALLSGQLDTYRLEKRYITKDGRVVWADTSVSPITSPAGENLASVGVIMDITQRRRSEQILRRLATAVEQAYETIEITDPEGTIVYVNPAFERTTGYSRKEAVGKSPNLVKSGQHDNRFYTNLWEAITSGNVWSGHLVNRKKDGTLFEEEVTISPIRDRVGKIVNYVAVKRDVTREISLQTQLLHAQKMEAIGTLAGGIAHDFNNLLQIVLGYSELLLESSPPEDPDHEDLHKIFQAAQSGAGLVQRMLMFSRKVEPEPVPVNLNTQIAQLENLLRRTIPRMIEIRMNLADDLAEINADPAQMEQVLMNLAVNARDAMPERGKLTLETRNVRLDDDYCRIHVGVNPGEYVLLQVSDTGHGMSLSTIEHIFEPFFTTKELGRGTGLGLAIVYGIVKQHDGHVTCTSSVGRGTTFRVYLPVMESESAPAPDTSVESPLPGTETVLLVDDEVFVRNLGERILTRGGYKVLTAEDGRDACVLFRRERNRIALVILDLIMPEMGGQECLRELLSIDPQVKVLVASGYAATTSAGETIASGAKDFVNKPFTMNELLHKVRKVIDAHQSYRLLRPYDDLPERFTRSPGTFGGAGQPIQKTPNEMLVGESLVLRRSPGMRSLTEREVTEP